MDALHQVCLMNQINEYWETFHCKLFAIYQKIVNIIYFYNSYCRISRSLTCSRTNNQFETMFFYDLSIKNLLLSFNYNTIPFQIDSNVWVGWVLSVDFAHSKFWPRGGSPTNPLPRIPLLVFKYFQDKKMTLLKRKVQTQGRFHSSSQSSLAKYCCTTRYAHRPGLIGFKPFQQK